jgi:hypothetical protein
MIFAEEDLNSLNAIAGLLASFGCDSQAGCVLYIQHKIAKAMEADERKCRNGNMSKKTWKLRVRSHMTEMQKLDILLTHAKISHTYGRRWPEMDRPDYQEYLPGGRHDGGEQIIVYDAAGNRIWDGIWGWGSYGFEQGLIEVMGAQLLGHDDVDGWLTARQVTKMWRCRNAAKNR